MNTGFLALLNNENMKIYRRPRTWILLGILLVFVVGLALLMNSFDPEYSGSEWRQQLQEEITNLENRAADENVPEQFKSSIPGQIAEKQYYLENDINPYEKNNWTYLSTSSGLIALISLFVVIVASDIVASEFTWGTIKMLMIRPHKRSSILLSKFFAALIFGVLMFVTLFAASWIVGGLMFGFSPFDFATVTFQDGEIIKETVGIQVLKIYGLEFLSLIVVIALSFMISTVFRSGSLAIGIGIFVLFAGSLLNGFLFMFDWGKYVLFANLSLSAYVNNNVQPFMDDMTLTFSLIVNAVYFVIFIILTWWIFNKRDIAA